VLKRLITIIGIGLYAFIAGAQDNWVVRHGLDTGNASGTYIEIMDSVLLIRALALCRGNSESCAGFISINPANGELTGKGIIFDSVKTNASQALSSMNGSVLLNINTTDRSRCAVASFRDSGELIDIFDYYVVTDDECLSGSIDSNDSTTFVVYGTKVENGPYAVKLRALDAEFAPIWTASIEQEERLVETAELQTSIDGGVVVSYTTLDPLEYFDQRVSIAKFSSTGVMEWETSLPYSGDWDSHWSKIADHPDGGYVGTWPFDSTIFYKAIVPNVVYKLKADGEIEWERIVWDRQFTLLDVFAAQDGGVFGCGIAEHWPWGEDTVMNYRVPYVIKLDANGNEIWDRKIIDTIGGADRIKLYAGVELSNGDIVFTGDSRDLNFGTPDDPFPYNIYAIKLDSNGCFYPGCGEWQNVSVPTTSVKTIKKEHAEVRLFPNPANDYMYLGLGVGDSYLPGEYRYYISSTLGQIFMDDKFNPNVITQIMISNLHSGMYVLTITRNGKILKSNTFTKIEK